MGMNGDGAIFFRYARGDTLLTIESEQHIDPSEWSHVAVSVNEENATLQLFINGSEEISSELPIGIAADLSDHLYWNLGGVHPIEKDYYYGRIDDVRFYNEPLSEEDVLSIYNDDITDRPIVGSRTGNL